MSFISYLRETQAELKFVKWPSQHQTFVYTALVITVSVLTAFFLGFFDFLFTKGLDKFVI